MGKNFGGKKYKKKDMRQRKSELVIKEEGQAYVKVEKMLGNGRLSGNYTSDNGNAKQIQCVIPGRFKRGRRNWIEANDWLLVVLPDFSKDGHVIHKYHPNDVKTLIKRGEITDIDTKKKTENVEESKDNIQDDNPFTFEDEDTEIVIKSNPKQKTTMETIEDDEEFDFDDI